MSNETIIKTVLVDRKNRKVSVDRTRQGELTAMPGSTLAACDCGANVEINIASGGTRYEAAMFSVECPQCGTVVEDCIPSNCSGRRRDAVAEWNLMQKAKNANTPCTPK